MATGAKPSIQVLGPVDAPALLDLDRRAPITAGWRFRYDREPDFFAWPRLLFDEWVYLGAFVEGQLVGYGMVGTYLEAPTTPEGRPRRLFYVGDGRVLPEHRGAGIARTLLAAGPEALTGLPGPPPDHGWALVARDNPRARSLISGWSVPGFHMDSATTFTALTVPARIPRSPLPLASRSGLRVQVVGAEAIDEAAAAFDHLRRGRPLAAHITATQLGAHLSAGALHGMLLVHRGAEVVGAAGLWDPVAARRLVLDGYPPRLGAVAPALARVPLARRVLTDLVPAPGATLNTVTLSPLAADGPSSLRALVRAARRWAVRNARVAVHVGITDGDPAAAGLVATPGLHLKSQVIQIARDHTREHEPGPDPHGTMHIDLAMV
jgi:GNAT superfamily N-acetyltransferase